MTVDVIVTAFVTMNRSRNPSAGSVMIAGVLALVPHIRVTMDVMRCRHTLVGTDGLPGAFDLYNRRLMMQSIVVKKIILHGAGTQRWEHQ